MERRMAQREATVRFELCKVLPLGGDTVVTLILYRLPCHCPCSWAFYVFQQAQPLRETHRLKAQHGVPLLYCLLSRKVPPRLCLDGDGRRPEEAHPHALDGVIDPYKLRFNL